MKFIHAVDRIKEKTKIFENYWPDCQRVRPIKGESAPYQGFIPKDRAKISSEV